MARRNTIQKDMVLKTVRELKRHLTADEVYGYIKKDHPNIGKGTVYRNLGILAEEGAIRKVEVPDGPEPLRFHIKKTLPCQMCGV